MNPTTALRLLLLSTMAFLPNLHPIRTIITPKVWCPHIHLFLHTGQGMARHTSLVLLVGTEQIMARRKCTTCLLLEVVRPGLYPFWPHIQNIISLGHTMKGFPDSLLGPALGLNLTNRYVHQPSHTILRLLLLPLHCITSLLITPNLILHRIPVRTLQIRIFPNDLLRLLVCVVSFFCPDLSSHSSRTRFVLQQSLGHFMPVPPQPRDISPSYNLLPHHHQI